ncbi:MAG: Mut7-C RNAse domain-containing protein [Candidatus Micrarchaeia archaeon]
MVVFLIDAMLKNIVRWLRIFGRKTIYALDLKDLKGKPLDDEELLKIALKNKMVFVTRDEALGQKARDYVPTILLRTTDTDKQLMQILTRFPAKITLAPSKTTCASCGGKIKRVLKASVKDKVFPKVFKHNKTFWQCKKCKKTYWKGSHWKKILQKARKISQKLKTNRF